MPIESGQIYAVQFVYTLNSQECRNVQFYRCAAANDVISLTEVAGYLGDYAKPEYVAITTKDTVGSQVIVEDVTFGLEFGAAVWNWQGADAGNTLPPYACYAIRLNRGTKITRNGYKRIAGVPEAVQDAGDLTPAAIAAVQNAADTLFGQEIDITLPDDREFSLVPLIVGRNATGKPDLTRVQNVQSVTVLGKTTTQNSRKFDT